MEKSENTNLKSLNNGNIHEHYKSIEYSKFDQLAIKRIRNNVDKFIEHSAKYSDKYGHFVLDVAPQVHKGVTAVYKKAIINTVDIDETVKTHFHFDICNVPTIHNGTYHSVICTEVLEHTLNPFKAVNGIRNLLKPGGLAWVSTPFDFRIHGPSPDCWRFTYNGLKELFKDFSEVKITQDVNPLRPNMPLQYFVLAKR